MRPPDAIAERGGFLAAGEDAFLYVRHYEPPGGLAPGEPVLLVPPDGEERTWSQRALVHLARFLARRGHPVVRFDFRGQGESDGRFEETDVASRLEDLRLALAYTTATCGQPPAIVAVRLGANVASHLLSSGAAPGARLIAVEPVDSVEAYLGDLLRKNVSSQFVVHKKVVANRKQLLQRIAEGASVGCSGFQLARPFVDSLPRLQPAAPASPDAHTTTLRLDGVPAFWTDGPTFRSHPTPLFEAVAATLRSRRPAPPPESPPPLAAGAGGREILFLDGEAGRVAATWHPGDAGNPCFLFLNPGPNDRSGPHGMYVRLAEALAARGYPVLRIDGNGVGESDGPDETFQGRAIPEVHREINSGAQAPAALAALRWIHGRCGTQVTMMGLCGGAVTGVLAAERARAWDTRLVLLGVPVLHLGISDAPVLPERVVHDEFRRMVTKLSRFSHLARLLTFRTDYRLHWRVVREKAGLAWKRRFGRSNAAPPAGLHPQTNLALLEAWERFAAAGGQATFVYAEYDGLLAQFNEFFAPLARGGKLPDGTELLVLDGTTHNVTERSAEDRLLAFLLSTVAESRARATR